MVRAGADWRCNIAQLPEEHILISGAEQVILELMRLADSPGGTSRPQAEQRCKVLDHFRLQKVRSDVNLHSFISIRVPERE